MSKQYSPDEKWQCECGKRHEFGVYVAAHSKEELTHTCDSCSAVHSVFDYTVELVQPGRAALDKARGGK